MPLILLTVFHFTMLCHNDLCYPMKNKKSHENVAECHPNTVWFFGFLPSASPESHTNSFIQQGGCDLRNCQNLFLT